MQRRSPDSGRWSAGRWGWILLLVSLLSSCNTAPPRKGEPTPVRWTPNYYLFSRPNRIKNDYTFPDDFRLQKFRWMEERSEWQFRLPAGKAAHCSFDFVAPHDYAGTRNNTSLTFLLKPRFMARYLRLGLLDREHASTRALVVMPVQPFWLGMDMKKEWGIYAIPLSSFPDRGVAVGEGAEGEKRMNWSELSGIRFLAAEDAPTTLSVVVAEMRFGRPHRPYHAAEALAASD